MITFSKAQKILGPCPASPKDQAWVYQSGRAFQLSPDTVGLMCNIRPGGAATVDLAVGNDLLILSDLNNISDAKRFEVNRSRYYDNPKDGKIYLLSMIWSKGSFIPLGAKRKDGTAHPHAGTGFGCVTEVGYPDKFKVNTAELYKQWENYQPKRGFENPLGPKSMTANPNPVVFHRVHQYQYDGETFKITSIDDFEFPQNSPYQLSWPGWGLRNGLPDGDDILFPISAIRKSDNKKICGVMRWKRQNNKWETDEFLPVPDTVDCMEPTIERDYLGRLFFTCRGHNKIACACNIRVWISEDNGITWQLTIDEPQQRASSPVTINRTVSGKIFILGNRLDLIKLNREVLTAWPLSDDGNRLLSSITVLDSTAEFGLFKDQYDWYVDHPVGEIVSFADGVWRSIITHRLANRIEVGFDLPLTPLTGTYIEEVFDNDEALPRWEF